MTLLVTFTELFLAIIVISNNNDNNNNRWDLYCQGYLKKFFKINSNNHFCTALYVKLQKCYRSRQSGGIKAGVRNNCLDESRKTRFRVTQQNMFEALHLKLHSEQTDAL